MHRFVVIVGILTISIVGYMMIKDFNTFPSNGMYHSNMNDTIFTGN